MGAILEEGRHFIEWTAIGAELEVQVWLLHMQRHLARWDLQSATEGRVAPGVYHLRLEADTPRASHVARIVVIR